ncbi:hypothetical protein HPB49_010626 [Dermacentor silvarum]|uniref:Uncharacterized protein n=1 Tax=Dermacentor silvarum TaxID=543639 RepID=A0ACB8D4H2_DERSI|nr:hypothetical protein HPB49_010626 [Dermacentor silvarum]
MAIKHSDNAGKSALVISDSKAACRMYIQGRLPRSVLRIIEQWGEFFAKYTNNTYQGVDSVFLQTHVINMLEMLLEDKSVGEKGLRHLVAWSVYTQLVDYTKPWSLVGHKKASDACYEHVGRAMKLALVSPYLQSIGKPMMLERVRTMFANIRNVFRDAFNFSTWVKGDVREIAIRKLDRMKSRVGSPGLHLDAAFVEELYRPFPDVPLDGLFPTWIKAVSLSSHYLWTDQTTWLYDEAAVNAFYRLTQNTIVIPTAIIQRPLYYYEGPLALSYGGLGMVNLLLHVHIRVWNRHTVHTLKSSSLFRAPPLGALRSMRGHLDGFRSARVAAGALSRAVVPSPDEFYVSSTGIGSETAAVEG